MSQLKDFPKEVQLKIREKCELWLGRDYSMLPSALIQRAYEGSCFEDIEIVAPTFEQFKKEYFAENCSEDDYDCEDCPHEDCYMGYDDDNPKLPMWGWLFRPNNNMDEEWIRKNTDKVGECGIIVYETEEIGIYLGINGAGYDFYESHWIPLYLARGLKWHE